MFSYGSQVNPALLRQDFSSILQGAQAQAQGITQAAQTRAQSMANIGSQISEGFKTYVKNREQNSVLDGRIGRILNSRPELANDPELKSLFEERAKKGGLPLDKSQKLFSALETTLELDKVKEDRERQQAYLKLQQDAAAINAERSAREKAEYERKNKFQTGMIAALQKNPDVLKDPDSAAQLSISLGGNLEDLSSIQGFAMSRENWDRNKQIYNLDLTERNLRIADAVQKRDLEGKGDLFEVQEKNGVQVVIGKDRFGNPTSFQVVKAEPPSQGQKLRSEASKYYSALNSGNMAAAAEAVANARRLTAGQKFENYEDDEFAKKVFGPFQGDLGATPTAGPQEKLVTKGGLKPVSATPSPTAEDNTITRAPSSPLEMRLLNAPASELVNEGRQWMQGDLGSNASAVSDEVKARFTSIFGPYGSGRGDFQTQAPAPAAAAAPAPAAPAAPTPAPAPAPGIQYPPVQDIVIPQEPRPPVQDIILDESLLRRPSTVGRMFAPAPVDKNQPPVITESMLRKAARERPIEPGQKNITATQLNRLIEERAAAEPAKIRQSALKLLEPKKGDSPDTRAIKQIIPYLNNQALADKLLKELSENKEPKLSSLEKDPFVRSMFNAAKEGRLPQLNMAAGRGF